MTGAHATHKPPRADQVDPLPLIDPHRQLVLITNAKCGGSSMKAAFFRMLDIPAAPWQFASLARRYSIGFAKDFHLSGGTRRYRAMLENGNVGSFTGFYTRRVSWRAMRAVRGPDWRKIAIVRHPFARAVSGFLDKFCTENRSRPWVTDVIAQGGNGSNLSFRQFVTYLEATDNDRVNRHWRRQTFVMDFFDTSVEMVRLEHLSQDVEALEPALPKALRTLPISNANPFSKTGRWTGEAGSAPDLTNLALIKMRAAGQPTPAAEDFLTSEMRNRLRKIYSRDFTRLPYD